LSRKESNESGLWQRVSSENPKPVREAARIAYHNDMTIRAAIFDFDELLINLQTHHFAADRAAMAALGHDYDDLPETIRLGSSGRRISELLAEMREHFGIAEPVDALMRRRQEHFLITLRDAPELPAMPGAVEAVSALYDAGYPLAVASSGIREYIALVLDRLGIAERFQAVVTGADVAHGKPHPEPYLVTAARLGVPPAACVVFEDATVGVLAAKSAGMRCIAVPNPEATQTQDLSAADLILPSLTHFTPALLGQWD
jgi:HAD superfamily hydrolase (TIGR01509 family)